jgi:ribonuclease HII
MLRNAHTDDKTEAGCDEAGRGCLAGPVFAAAVIFDKDYQNPLLNDSKQLSEKERQKLKGIIENDAAAYAVAKVDAHKIDDINILNASYLAMHKAISKLIVKPELLIIDGNRFRSYKKIPHICIVKGDGKYLSIAAASILAKTYRDEYMKKASKKHPGYGWETNKGYPTLSHKLAIAKLGLSPLHRKSFNYNIQLKLEL